MAEHNVHVLTGEKNGLNDDLISGYADPGEEFAITFHQPGTYRYICGLHPYMQGYIVVKDGD